MKLKGPDTDSVGDSVLVCSIQHDILDINDIFRDLGTMVHEQGGMVGESIQLYKIIKS